MINLLLGPPGGGKSYEAVVYHVLPALKQGRRVITNLPLELDKIDLVQPGSSQLIELRSSTLAVQPVEPPSRAGYFSKRTGSQKYFNKAAFSHAEDYGDPWRHPDTGSGPLYVIDECHMPLPVSGTPIEVEHWYSLHRHESADVLLITQSYGKINRAIRDLVQVCYRVKKNTSLGSSKTYSRKVQDGLKGEVTNLSIRHYKPEYFGLYRSHTLGGGAELAANDIVPIWQNWTFKGAALCFLILIGMAATGNIHNPLKPKALINPAHYSAHQAATPNRNGNAPALPVAGGAAVKTESVKPPPADDPYAAYGVHIAGHLLSAKKNIYLFSLSRNGQKIRNLTSGKFVQVGYNVQYINECAAWIQYKTTKRFITCDNPTMTIFSSIPESSKPAIEIPEKSVSQKPAV